MAAAQPPLPYHRPTVLGTEAASVQALLEDPAAFAERRYSKACLDLLQPLFPGKHLFLTGACTHALELAALLLDLKPGDEVMVPSFAHVADVNAFVKHGATPVFVDVRPDTLAIDMESVYVGYTSRTRAIVAVHYAGLPAPIEDLKAFCVGMRLRLIEDAAHGLGASWGKPNQAPLALGNWGDAACLSFGYTKHLTGGEGGLLVMRETHPWLPRARAAFEEGTNRTAFEAGEVDAYTWTELGGHYRQNEVAAAWLLPQLQAMDAIVAQRRALWFRYQAGLADLAQGGHLLVPTVPAGAQPNGNLYWVMTLHPSERTALAAHLAAQGIGSAFHYQPLHASPMGRRVGRLGSKGKGAAPIATAAGERLLRLPLYHGLQPEDVDRVVAAVRAFYGA